MRRLKSKPMLILARAQVSWRIGLQRSSCGFNRKPASDVVYDVRGYGDVKASDVVRFKN